MPATTQGSDDVYAVQLDIAIAGALDPHRLRDGRADGGHSASAPGGAILCTVRRAGAGHPG